MTGTARRTIRTSAIINAMIGPYSFNADMIRP
jgi:hypothetical protein